MDISTIIAVPIAILMCVIVIMGILVILVAPFIMKWAFRYFLFKRIIEELKK